MSASLSYSCYRLADSAPKVVNAKHRLVKDRLFSSKYSHRLEINMLDCAITAARKQAYGREHKCVDNKENRAVL